MLASDGEILTLRPVGFTPSWATIESYLGSLPGAYHRPNTNAWTLVVPATDAPRMLEHLAGPTPQVFALGDPEWVEVELLGDGIWIHPGRFPSTWARAQNVVIWLLQIGPWRVTGATSGQARELGIVRSALELFRRLYDDPDLPRLDPSNPTESPPRVGRLVTFRRYLGDIDANYFHTFVRVHDSGAFSCEHTSEVDDLRWQARLTPDSAAKLCALVDGLDFLQSSPGSDRDFRDRVAVVVEEQGRKREKILDAASPPESFAALVRTMDGWGQDLLDDKIPVDLGDVVASSTPKPGAASENTTGL